jgi:predicted nucleic acid-binding protein
MFLIDTNIAIYLRDGHREMTARVNALPRRPAISLMTRVELEGGIYRHPEFADARRVAVDALVRMLEVEPVDDAIITTYGRIVATCGFSRTKIIDRLIAATALVNDLTLITVNAADFRDIPRLRLEHWPAPGQ